MRTKADQTIGALAARQHGVVTRRQLIDVGLSPSAVDRRVKQRWLHPLHRGVYAVGPIRSPRTKEVAAVMACGPSAVVSHRSAAALWGLVPGDPSADVEVIVPRGDRRRPGIRIRYIRTLRTDEVTRLDGIRVTRPARTLLDLAACSRPRQLERATAEAFARNLTTPARLRSVLRRHPRTAGIAKLRSLVEGEAPLRTRSEAEEQFLALVRKSQLSRPQSNVSVCGYEVDFLWRPERLVVEVDGRGPHSSPRAFERDRRRDAELTAAGMRVVRVTWRQITEEPLAVIARLAQALARGRRPES
ncbi:MAG: type IV toxin-antitoxin system AbiEi family antitoxin domain-containing protein [Gemmatimonadota bacterium]